MTTLLYIMIFLGKTERLAAQIGTVKVNPKNAKALFQASQITFICPMIFNYFPLDTQVGG